MLDPVSLTKRLVVSICNMRSPPVVEGFLAGLLVASLLSLIGGGLLSLMVAVLWNALVFAWENKRP